MKHKPKLSPEKLLALGFIAIILFGTLLLTLPIASNNESASFVDALFTATSATCVTGLTTLTTATQWTLFGKIVIILLIQVGGLGFMTFISLCAIIANKNLSLRERKLMVQATGSLELRGIIKLVKQIALGTALIEGIGAIILTFRFLSLGNTFIKSLWYGLFHSISAFCNAGFDILGDNSLNAYKSDPVILITIAVLVIIGGIGFLVWNDVINHKLKFKDYRLHSKLAIVITAILIFGGWVIIYITERNESFYGFTEGEKILNAFFQSVTLRTAGFASVNQENLSFGGTVISVMLMLIGGCPGSTAGGIKTITFLIVILNAVSFARNKDSLTVFKKRIHDSTVKQACAIMTLYLLASCAITVAICLIEGNAFSLGNIVYEVVSAVATVGLTQGITPLLSIFSKLLLCLTMYFGRLGGLTLLLAIAEKQQGASLQRPYEKILIG